MVLSDWSNGPLSLVRKQLKGGGRMTTRPEEYNGLRYDKARAIVNGPSKSDLMESLCVGSPSRGIERPYVEICYDVDDQAASIRAEVGGLIRLRGENDEWEVRGHIISPIVAQWEHLFVAIYNCRVRRGKLVLFNWKDREEMKAHLRALVQIPTF